MNYLKYLWNLIVLASFGVLTLGAYNGDRFAAVSLGVMAAIWYLLFLLQESNSKAWEKLSEAWKDMYYKTQSKERRW